MVYCQKCGKQNEAGAQFCNKCGTSLTGVPMRHRRSDDEQCDQECAGRGRSAPIFWGLIIVLIGIAILFEVVLEKIPGFEWAGRFEWWWLIAVVIALALIVAGLKMATRPR